MSGKKASGKRSNNYFCTGHVKTVGTAHLLSSSVTPPYQRYRAAKGKNDHLCTVHVEAAGPARSVTGFGTFAGTAHRVTGFGAFAA